MEKIYIFGPEDDDHDYDNDNHSNQLNPNNDEYHHSRHEWYKEAYASFLMRMEWVINLLNFTKSF